MSKRKNKHITAQGVKLVLGIIGTIVPIFAAFFSIGWYFRGNILSVEFHEKEMQLYNLHQQIDDRYKEEIRQLELEKRELEKEIFYLRNEILKKEK